MNLYDAFLGFDNYFSLLPQAIFSLPQASRLVARMLSSRNTG